MASVPGPSLSITYLQPTQATQGAAPSGATSCASSAMASLGTGTVGGGEESRLGVRRYGSYGPGRPMSLSLLRETLANQSNQSFRQEEVRPSVMCGSALFVQLSMCVR